MCKRNRNNRGFVFALAIHVSFISSLQAIPHDNEGSAPKNESECDELDDDAREAVGNSERLEELMGPPVVAVIRVVAFHLLTIASKNSLQRSLERVFDEREFKQPVPNILCVFHLHKEVRE